MQRSLISVNMAVAGWICLQCCPCYNEFRDMVRNYDVMVTVGVRVVLLRIPSSHPNPQTITQLVQIQIRGFLAAVNDGFETISRLPRLIHATARMPNQSARCPDQFLPSPTVEMLRGADCRNANEA